MWVTEEKCSSLCIFWPHPYLRHSCTSHSSLVSCQNVLCHWNVSPCCRVISLSNPVLRQLTGTALLTIFSLGYQFKVIIKTGKYFDCRLLLLLRNLFVGLNQPNWVHLTEAGPSTGALSQIAELTQSSVSHWCVGRLAKQKWEQIGPQTGWCTMLDGCFT